MREGTREEGTREEEEEEGARREEKDVAAAAAAAAARESSVRCGGESEGREGQREGGGGRVASATRFESQRSEALRLQNGVKTQ